MVVERRHAISQVLVSEHEESLARRKKRVNILSYAPKNLKFVCFFKKKESVGILKEKVICDCLIWLKVREKEKLSYFFLLWPAKNKSLFWGEPTKKMHYCTVTLL